MAVGNPWFNSVEQTLPQYIPLPFNELMAAGQQLQQRYDTNLAGLDQTATGLASIEARLPGHRQYVSDFTNRFRTEADELLSKYNYNAADPQFSRELTRLRSRYTNDPNLRTILMANEADKRNSELAAKMAAEGRLFINPQARGIDDQGRLINDVGQVRGVNTLDQYRERLKMASQARTEQGNMITNRPALEQAQSEIMSAYQSNAPEIQDLRQAYLTQGLTPERAEQQVQQDLQRLSGEYAVEEGTNWQKMNFMASERDRVERRALAAAKAKAEQEGSPSGPYFVSTQSISSDGKALLPEIKTVNGDQKIPLAGKMNVQINTKVEDLPLTGDLTVIGKNNWFNDYVKQKGDYTVKKGSFQGVEVPYVINNIEGGTSKDQEKVGRILSQDAGWWTGIGTDGTTSNDIDILTDDKGSFVYLDKAKKTKAYVQPQAMKVYRDSDEGNTIYQKIGYDETLTYLGPQGWKFANDTQAIMPDVQRILQQNNIDPSTLSQQDLDAIMGNVSQKYYDNRKGSLFAKPSTTTPITDYYFE